MISLQENSSNDTTGKDYSFLDGFDEPGGVLTAPFDEGFRVDIRSVVGYCRNRGIETSDMTDEEVAMFVIETEK